MNLFKAINSAFRKNKKYWHARFNHSTIFPLSIIFIEGWKLKSHFLTLIFMSDFQVCNKKHSWNLISYFILRKAEFISIRKTFFPFPKTSANYLSHKDSDPRWHYIVCCVTRTKWSYLYFKIWYWNSLLSKKKILPS